MEKMERTAASCAFFCADVDRVIFFELHCTGPELMDGRYMVQWNRTEHIIWYTETTDMELSVVTDSSSECEMDRSYVCDGMFAVFLLPWKRDKTR